MDYCGNGNHFAINLATKGLINPNSLITKGVILSSVYELYRDGRKTGSGTLMGPPYGKKLYDDIKRTEADTIKVFVKWDKAIDRDKKVTVELIKKEISVELLNNDVDIKIDVELID